MKDDKYFNCVACGNQTQDGAYSACWLQNENGKEIHICDFCLNVIKHFKRKYGELCGKDIVKLYFKELNPYPTQESELSKSVTMKISVN